jgi:hypothetical protein
MCFYVRSLCLLLCELHVLGSSSCCDVENNVIITFLHTHIKKKLYLLCEACCRNNEVHYTWYQSKVQPGTWDRYGFR